MKQIALKNKGKIIDYALVDDEDYDWLINYNWRYCRDTYDRDIRNTAYARSTPNSNGKAFRMHRLILERHGILDSHQKLVDHIDGDGLNNQKTNLRLVSNSQNCMNRTKPFGKYSSKYKGVCYEKEFKKWRCRIKKDGEIKFLQRFESEFDAAAAYDLMSQKIFGEYAKLNFDFLDKSTILKVEKLLKPYDTK